MEDSALSFEIAKLEVEDGDVLLVKIPAHVNIHRANEIFVNALKRAKISGVQLLFMTPDTEVSVLRKKDQNNAPPQAEEDPAPKAIDPEG